MLVEPLELHKDSAVAVFFKVELHGLQRTDVGAVLATSPGVAWGAALSRISERSFGRLAAQLAYGSPTAREEA